MEDNRSCPASVLGQEVKAGHAQIPAFGLPRENRFSLAERLRNRINEVCRIQGTRAQQKLRAGSQRHMNTVLRLRVLTIFASHTVRARGKAYSGIVRQLRDRHPAQSTQLAFHRNRSRVSHSCEAAERRERARGTGELYQRGEMIWIADGQTLCHSRSQISD